MRFRSLVRFLKDVQRHIAFSDVGSQLAVFLLKYSLKSPLGIRGAFPVALAPSRQGVGRVVRGALKSLPSRAARAFGV